MGLNSILKQNLSTAFVFLIQKPNEEEIFSFRSNSTLHLQLEKDLDLQ